MITQIFWLLSLVVVMFVTYKITVAVYNRFEKKQQ
jgi:hypothetical protein